ncbi:MAG: methyltransferase domain-containing protein [Deltaproteobacteria bacterium]|jgi:SAM-dependent methyltransferase|nr:methyltransferase domain-containing protein [Deltaproteobacteria bacterium]
MGESKWDHRGFMELTRGFWTLCAIQAGVELGLFTALDLSDGRRMPLAELARDIGSDERATGMLATALTGLGLLEREGQEIALPSESARFLSEKSPEYYGHMLLHQSHIMPAWIGLAQAVKTGRRVASSSAAESGDEKRREDFLMAMYNGARYQAEAVAEALDLSSSRNLLDLGGGPGTYAAQFCLKYSGLSAVIFDLPGSAPVAKKVLAKLGIADRVSFVAGDFNRDPLPKPFDAVLISQVIHQEGPPGAAALIAKAADVLNPGGILAIQEFFLNDDLTGPTVAGLFSLNMLVNTQAGQSYAYGQVREFMAQAGLADIKLQPAKLPPGSAIMVGTKV